MRTLSALAKNEGLDRAIGMVTGMPHLCRPAIPRLAVGSGKCILITEMCLQPIFRWCCCGSRRCLRRRTSARSEAPTLLVVGENDNPATVARADQMASLITGAQKFIIAGSGHMVNMDEPVTFNQSVLAFLRSKVPGY